MTSRYPLQMPSASRVSCPPRRTKIGGTPMTQPNGPEPKLRVLVVEDNADCADSMALLLNLFGHEVAVARDFASALQSVTDHSPDVVFLDIGLLGNSSGWDLAKSIKRQARK